MTGADRQKDLEARAKDLDARGKSAAAFAAIFALIAGGSFAAALPQSVVAVAGCVALAGLIAAWRFTVEARDADVKLAAAKKERARAELLERVSVRPLEDIGPTQIGVDPAAQEILPGGEVPEYVPRDVDSELQEAVAAALDGTGRWLVLVLGPPKVGKSRALFHALTRCARDHRLELVAPVDADALRASVALLDEPTHPSARTVLWLDDVEPFVDAGITLASLREWRSIAGGAIVVATYGGKGSEQIAGSASGGLEPIAAQLLQNARRISMAATTARELAPLLSAVSSEQAKSLKRHGLAAYLVAAPLLEAKLSTGRHAPGKPECTEGVAAVLAAVDWARCGRTDPISNDTLRQLWSSYLPPDYVASDGAFDAAIDWARRPVARSIALLLQRVASYQPFDYVVQLVRDRSGAEPPRDAAWTAAIESAVAAQALEVATAAYFHARFDQSADAFSTARESSVDEVASLAGYNLGVVLGQLGRSEEAVRVYDEVVARYGDATEPALREQVAKALVNKGVRLGALDRPADELGVYDEVVARYGDATEPALREQVASALVNKGVRLGALDRSEEAVRVYDEVVARNGDATEPALREQVASALVNKGVRLGALDRSADELGVYDEVVARYGDATEPALRERVASALVNKGVRLGALDRSADELGVYDEVVARYGDATEPALRERVASALFNKGVRLGALDRSADELGVYDEVVARYGDATEPALRERVASALVNKGVRLGALDRSADELGVYDEVVARYGDATEPALRARVAKALVNKGVRLGALDRPADELGVYDEVVARYGDATEPALREQVAKALVSKGVTLGALNRSEEAVRVYDQVVARYGDATDPILRRVVAVARTALSQRGSD